MAYEGWVHLEYGVVCPHCHDVISSEPDIRAILQAVNGHACEASSVTAHAGLASAAATVSKEEDGD